MKDSQKVSVDLSSHPYNKIKISLGIVRWEKGGETSLCVTVVVYRLVVGTFSFKNTVKSKMTFPNLLSLTDFVLNIVSAFL